MILIPRHFLFWCLSQPAVPCSSLWTEQCLHSGCVFSLNLETSILDWTSRPSHSGCLWSIPEPSLYSPCQFFRPQCFISLGQEGNITRYWHLSKVPLLSVLCACTVPVLAWSSSLWEGILMMLFFHPLLTLADTWGGSRLEPFHLHGWGSKWRKLFLCYCIAA